MRRFKLASCTAILLLAAVSTGRGDVGLEPVIVSVDSRVRTLVSLLSDPDPLRRADSVQRLINMGDSARSLLRKSLVSASPMVRSEVDQVLLHVSWIKPEDSDPIQKAFAGYAQLDAASRCVRVAEWMAPQKQGGTSALLRVLFNDPSATVRWFAAFYLPGTAEYNDDVFNQLAGLADGSIKSDDLYLPAIRNAPLLAAAGWACRLTAPARANALMQKSLDMEQEEPAAFNGQSNYPYFWLIEQATTQRDYARAVQLLRQQSSRVSWVDSSVPQPIIDLFAMQADFGPLPGFDEDVRTYRELFSHPEFNYSFARLAQRQGHAVASDTLNTIALLMSGDSVDSHNQIGTFLAGRRWNRVAEREFKWALNLSGHSSINAYFQLSALADDENDDINSARYEEAGLLKLDSQGAAHLLANGEGQALNTDDLWADVHWHYLRAARDAGDHAAVKLHLDKLISMDQEVHILESNPALAADIVPALEEQGQQQQADAIFETAYKALKQKCDAEPHSGMPKNNLAWLCVCSGKRMEEAAKLAADAVQEEPNDGATLDTLAEIYMRQGQPAKALTTEKLALLAKPDDIYMEKQIKRFQIATDAK